ncbi:MAG: shikimate dehydrogenase [Ruminococcaceae bacterium]|nr:shikimate dehydrogenase [Oscillospiraceae bacterium]
MKYGLIGERLGHSFSREIHAACADYEYELCELAPSELEGFMRAADFCAVNVTIPYKQAVIPFLHEIDARAKNIGAVNTVVNRGGKLYGYNTDFYGLSELIAHAGIELYGKKVLILGTGGTSRTARAVCSELGAREILTVSRSAGEGVITYGEAVKNHSDAEVIINTTPCGMFPNPDGCAIDISHFERLSGVLDAVYNPLRTDLVLNAKERGIAAEGGLYMLVSQGVRASRLFVGNEADAPTEKIYAKIRSDKENIVLTGMPASGKTTVGRALAIKLGREFYDTDVLIEKKTGKKISDIFAECGEAGFREIESDVVRQTANTVTGAVIATGGGAILRQENVRALKRSGRIYFLDRAIEKLVPTENRPTASSAEAIRKRYAERYGIYVSTSDVRVVTDESVEHTVNKIEEDFLK